MTPQEAISNLKRAKCVPYKKETLEMAIEALKVYPNDDNEDKPLKKYHVYATSEAEVTTDSEDELEIFNEAYDFLIANMDYNIVRDAE